MKIMSIIDNGSNMNIHYSFCLVAIILILILMMMIMSSIIGALPSSRALGHLFSQRLENLIRMKSTT